MRKNKNRNEYNTIYEKMGRATAWPSPLLGPPMILSSSWKSGPPESGFYVLLCFPTEAPSPSVASSSNVEIVADGGVPCLAHNDPSSPSTLLIHV